MDINQKNYDISSEKMVKIVNCDKIVERGDQEETDQGRQWCTQNVAPSGSWQGDSKTYLGAIY